MSQPLIFFGSGPVALESLKSLSKSFEVERVITKPRSPKQKDGPEVIAWAESNHLPLTTVANRAELDAAFMKLKSKSNIGIVVDFGIIISPMVINNFSLGIINSHFSLLPELRGPDPITFAILEGKASTGVSLMRIVPELDEGLLLDQQTLALIGDETTPILTTKLISLSQKMLNDILPKYIKGDIKLYEQDPSKTPTYTRKLHKSDSELSWTKPAYILEREVRAFIEWPKSKVVLFDREVIVRKASVSQSSNGPGEVSTTAGEIVIGCSDGKGLKIERLIIPGKPETSAKDFIAGYVK